MEKDDDELVAFEAHGAAPLPTPVGEGYVEHDGARIWYAAYGAGPPVVLLHGGLGHGGNWGHQVPALSGFRTVLIDSRGHGRSTRDSRPYSYTLMAADTAAVMDALGISKAALIGWSDGACTGLALAMAQPSRVAGLFFFACNVDPSGTKAIVPAPILDRCLSRHARDYARLSATPDGFAAFAKAVETMMQTQPDYSRDELGRVTVPVTVALSERDEFIKLEHGQYLADAIPGAEFVRLDGVSHFAPLQRPTIFNRAMLAFLARIGWMPGA